LWVYNESKKEWVKNPKLELAEIYKISAEKRPLQRITPEDP
jgi:hypothetical protein